MKRIGEQEDDFPYAEPDENCKPGPDDGIPDEMKRSGNNKAHQSKIKRRAIAAMVKKSKRRNRK